MKGEVPVHSGARKASLPSGHLFLISVQFIKCPTSGLLKELDNEQSLGNRTPRVHLARCCPCVDLRLTTTFGGE